jgi:hypothetical protein
MSAAHPIVSPKNRAHEPIGVLAHSTPALVALSIDLRSFRCCWKLRGAGERAAFQLTLVASWKFGVFGGVCRFWRECKLKVSILWKCEK